MDIYKALEDFIVDEPNSNIGYLVEKTDFIEIIEKISLERNSTPINLSKYNSKRFPFIGEFFETLIIENSENILQPLFAKQLSKVIQKNRMLILITDIEIKKLKNIYEPFDFTDFTSIQIGEINFVLLKKWFKW